VAQAGSLVYGVNDYPSPEAARAALARLTAAFPEGSAGAPAPAAGSGERSDDAPGPDAESGEGSGDAAPEGEEPGYAGEEGEY